ncbi:unnamed protein product [Didymodactylos carnosus]|uniref:LamG-like jellyroll fold domain-containing protein n=1 Tax=Didymodactylos carnosus TaxID=1234261 RepID=A0A8S2RYC2_9BILA|nr:unnamed protein product [Didymodactylos carnosus]CAF4190309.1 unnamed protein product [Didymodactylos carnosus]
MPMSSEIDSSYVPQPITKRQIISNERYRILNSSPSTKSSARSNQTIPSGKSGKRVSLSVIQFNNRQIPEVPSHKKGITRKCLLITLGILSVCVIAAIVIPIAIIFSRSTATTSTTTVTTVVTSAYWSFDNTTNDLYGVYNGVLVNGATYYTSPGNNYQATPFTGNGQSLALASSLNQSVLISSPFFNLSYTSFTLEAWIYATTLSGDNDIFGQCQNILSTNGCLYLIIRSARLYMGFSPNYLTGSTILTINTWYHVAYVYNYQTLQQILYVNGVQDAIQSSVQPYTGQNGSITIGTSSILPGSNYFVGYIDNVALTTRAKSATELLSDATMIFYFSFDNPNPSYDNGPNFLNGTVANVATVSGRVNQALRFTGSSSYFQMYGFYNWGFYTKPFSIAMWVNPISLVGGTLLHFSDFIGGTGSCVDIIGLTSGGQIMIQAWYSNLPAIVGPQLTINTWTHIGYTFSTTNGIILYVNGVMYLSTPSTGFYTSGYIMYITLGYNLGCCGCGNLPNIPYQGSIDEVHIYRRELSATEIATLANP